jgi:hypothetical protein
MSQTWRSIARPIIAETIKKVGTGDEKVLKKALREAYPFGERAYYPYKVWLDEIKVQTGKKKGTPMPADPRQKTLW